MTTLLQQRFRSKSIADVFQATEIEEDQEDLLPGQNSGSLKSTLEKWKSSLVMNFPFSTQPVSNSHPKTRRSRANSIFSRPPTHPHPRRKSLAEMLRKPAELGEDIKKIWDRRPSLNGLKSHLKFGRSNENIPGGTVYQNENNYRIPTPSNSFSHPSGSTDNDNDGSDNEMPLPTFFVVDRSAWKLPS